MKKVSPLARIVEFGNSQPAELIDEAIGILRMIKAQKFGKLERKAKGGKKDVKPQPVPSQGAA